jgi:phosphatidyl-myo-inositol alpha-mannosyltransferase
MKRIIISNYDSIKNPFYGGGGAYAIHEIAKRLVDEFEVLVITSRYPNSKDEIVDRVFYKRVGLSASYPLLAQLVFQFSLPFYVLKYRNTFDIWIESFTPPFSTACLQLLTKRPVIGLVHLLGAKDMSRKYHLPFELFEHWGVKTYRDFIVLNESVRRKIREINPNARISVIPNGIDRYLTNIKLHNKEKKHILFIGRLDIQQKGLDILLEAFGKIYKHTKYNLIICGSGYDKTKEELKTKIQSLHLEDRVKLVGYVTGDKKAKMFANAVVMAMPSRYETQPLTLLESFSFGLPVICFDIEDLNWLSQDYSVKVPAFDVGLYAEALLQITNSEKMRGEFSQRVKQYSKQFDWDVLAEKYKKLIHSLIANTIL